ncbi:DUF7848 domain-containing protein [Streptomyces sp. BE230]|uniref:DUF7848 domain-containing protein n=1 Tax=Streptomyces sp. BE230 TaxID=3002526 RepID=UPI003FA6BC7F
MAVMVAVRKFRTCAIVVRRGDLVLVRGQWLAVTGSRLDRFATGGVVVVVSFDSGRPLRLPVFMQLTVLRRAARLVRPVSVVRDRSWALRADASGCLQVYEVECVSCHDRCDASNEAESAERDQWCIRHVGETGHTGYREIRTGLLRAVAHAAEGRGEG